MGVVYAARDERLGRAVAMKMIARAVESGPPALLAGGARGRQRQPSAICQIYEMGEEDGELFIAMEMLEGESLAARIAPRAAALAEAVAIALAGARRRSRRCTAATSSTAT